MLVAREFRAAYSFLNVLIPSAYTDLLPQTILGNFILLIITINIIIIVIRS
jgi:hypothetical protein